MRICFEVIVFFTCLICYGISSSDDKKNFWSTDIVDFDDIEDFLTHERYARHVQTITESVVDHIVKELRKFPEVRKLRGRGRLNQIAEDMNTMMQIMKRKRIRTRQMKREEKNGTKRSSVFWMNKFMFHTNA